MRHSDQHAHKDEKFYDQQGTADKNSERKIKQDDNHHCAQQGGKNNLTDILPVPKVFLIVIKVGNIKDRQIGQPDERERSGI